VKYAVIRLQGRQYIVSPKEEILVDFLGDKKPSPEVLLVTDDKKVKIGKPVLKTAKVGVKILGEEKGENSCQKI
jgi:ribosomal protein L21